MAIAVMATIAIAGRAAAADLLDVKQTPIAARAIECLRAHASEVAAATPTLTDAVDFLMTDLCAEEVGRYKSYLTNASWLRLTQSPTVGVAIVDSGDAPSTPSSRRSAAQWQATMAAATIDPDTAEIRLPPGAKMSLPVTNWSEALRQDNDAYLRAVAAKAILEARKAAH
ncbi:MAG TPA: hypothetical protein VG939_21590 [Caulobacteraceae bacterium]|nr:hypothetical protein [Caulobacteraceae bacterium]